MRPVDAGVALNPSVHLSFPKVLISFAMVDKLCDSVWSDCPFLGKPVAVSVLIPQEGWRTRSIVTT